LILEIPVTVILRQQAVISGGPGGNGVITTYWRPGTGGGSTADATDIVARVRAWLNTQVGALINTVALVYNPVCEAIEDTTGDLVGLFTGTAVANSIGTSVTWTSPEVAMLVSWRTASVINGRLLQGRTFISPLAAAAIDASGQLAAATKTSLQTASTGLLTGGGTASFPVTWRRPHTASTKDPRPSYLGDSRAIASAVVSSRLAVLKSRRP
jgi:hypothetical protein